MRSDFSSDSDQMSNQQIDSTEKGQLVKLFYFYKFTRNFNDKALKFKSI